MKLSLSCTPTPTLTPTHTHTHIYSHPSAPSLSLPHSLSSLTPTLTFTHAHAHAHTLSAISLCPFPYNLLLLRIRIPFHLFYDGTSKSRVSQNSTLSFFPVTNTFPPIIFIFDEKFLKYFVRARELVIFSPSRTKSKCLHRINERSCRESSHLKLYAQSAPQQTLQADKPR